MVVKSQNQRSHLSSNNLICTIKKPEHTYLCVISTFSSCRDLIKVTLY